MAEGIPLLQLVQRTWNNAMRMNKYREHRDPRHPEWAVKALAILLVVAGVLALIQSC